MTTITLEVPLSLQGQTVETLTIRRPKVRDLKRMDRVKGDMERMITLICDLSEPPLTPDNVADMDAADMARIGAVIADFFPKASPTDGG